jgi:2-aminoadipate transaminase
MMIIDLDKTKKIPLYIQISRHFTELIEKGLLPPGSRLPATRELASSLAVSRNTVVLAFQDLEVKGLATSHVGRGAFVNTYLPKKIPTQKKNSKKVLHLEGLFAGSWPKSFSPQLEIIDRISYAETGSNVINLASSLPDKDLFPVREFRDCLYYAMGRYGSDLLASGSPRGFQPLLEYLPVFLSQRNLFCDPQNLMIVSGNQQALSLIGRLLVDPGDTVILENLTYPEALGVFRSLKANCVGIPLDQDGLRIDVLESVLARTQPKLLYTIPTFQNPTGTCLSNVRRKQLVELCQKKEALIVEDDYASELSFEGRAALPLKAWDEGEGIIYLGSFSELLFPGIRLSFVLAPSPVIDRLALMKQSVDLYSNRIMQGALLEFCERGLLSKLIKKKRVVYRKRRDALSRAVEEHFPSGIWGNPPVGGLFRWIDLPQELDALDLLMRTRERGVLFAPDRMFSVEAWERSGLRLGFAYVDDERIRQGIKILGQTMREMVDRLSLEKYQKGKEVEE